MGRFRLGAYEFINCLPVYAAIHQDEVRLPLGVELVESVPAVLNNSVLFGEIDVTPVSASHHVGREDRFAPLPDLAITSDGPVQSVLLLHEDPIKKLDDRPVGITQKSSTARTMLQILMAEHWRVKPSYNIGPCYAQDLGDRYDAVLVIGDDALSVHDDPPEGVQVTDIGEAWKELTGGPAIWALWVAREEFRSRHDELYGKLEDCLLQSKEWGLDHMDRVVEIAADRSGLDPAVVGDYFDHLGYDLDGAAEKALETLAEHKSRL